MAGKVGSTEFTRKDDIYCQYGEDKYFDEYNEESSDSGEEYNDEDDDSFDNFPVIKSDSASPEVHPSYNDTSTSVLLANKLNITPLHLFFGDSSTIWDPTSPSFYMKIALLLLSAASMDQLNKSLIRGRRLLQTTLERKDDQLTLALLDTGIDTVSPDEGTPPQTALETLCIHGSRNNLVIRRIIMNHVDDTTLNADGSTMLHLACICRQINVFEELIHAGWKTEVSNKDGKPLILQAIESGSTKMVNLLLEHGSILLDKYLYRSTIGFSLSSAQNATMCQLLNENGINNWHQEATMSFWGNFLPDISTMKTRYSSPSSSGPTQWLSAAIERVTPLHIASFEGNETVLHYALDLGNNVDINLAAKFGTTPLFFAVTIWMGLDPELELVQGDNFVSPAIEEAIRCRDLGTLKRLLQNGYSLEGSCYCGCSPLLVALTVAGKEISHLLAEAGASLDGVVVCPIPRPTAGCTPLHLAALYGDEQLLEKFVDVEQSNSVQSVHPLHIAAYSGNSSCIRKLLSRDFDGKCGVNDKTSLAEPLSHQQARMLTYKDGEASIIEDICGTSLHYASWRGHMDVMAELLRFGADLDAQDASGYTPLNLAAIHGHHQACDLLISAGASVLSRDYKNHCPIHCAIHKKHHRIVEIMTKELVIFDILFEDGDNLLDYACSYGNAETIEILIAAGMNINSTDNYEWPALFSAILNEFLTEEFQIKLIAGADDPYQTSRSESLLTLLCSRCLLLATRYLLERLCKENIQQYVNYVSIGSTALYCTAANSQERSLKLAELLIEHGAELEIIKPSHGTPLMGACYHGCYDMVALLLRKGAITTCNKRDGTQMTAVEEARHHPDIVSLLKNFEERGIEALNEPRPARIANIMKAFFQKQLNTQRAAAQSAALHRAEIQRSLGLDRAPPSGPRIPLGMAPRLMKSSFAHGLNSTSPSKSCPQLGLKMSSPPMINNNAKITESPLQLSKSSEQRPAKKKRRVEDNESDGKKERRRSAGKGGGSGSGSELKLQDKGRVKENRGERRNLKEGGEILEDKREGETGGRQSGNERIRRNSGGKKRKREHRKDS
ncbi:hypothetical protein BTUL_0168g00030 [Botrytis tulipae]|uniref:Uncharacterized protein n=1 Tax=Botrytis tulipae TaxID=87230 RepID=A0A4Z1EAU8_9HELO|nr:hypothetical protein BTUL_0168g00030 [Botrytis tulipae]